VTGVQRVGWPVWLIVVWWVASLVFPVMCLVVSVRQLPDKADPQIWWLVAGLVGGWALANGVAFGLAVLERWTLGHINGVADAGILPFEGLVLGIRPWTFWGVPTWLFGNPGTGFSWLLRGPGYTDPNTGVLLPGHAQLLIVALVSFGYYAGRYFWDLGN